MSDNSLIEWTDATWNPITGCSVVSSGCKHCYAMKLAGGRLRHHPTRAGLTVESKAGPVWTGEVRFNDVQLLEPLRWSRPRKIFVCAHGDLFAEGVPDEWIDKVFAVMALCPQHVFQVLTKRPERMRGYLTREAGDGRQDVRNHLCWEVTGAVANQWHPGWKDERPDGPHRARVISAFSDWPLPNVWLGVSAEDQQRADQRIPQLLAAPAAKHFVSLEPLLGPIELGALPSASGIGRELDALSNAGVDPGALIPHKLDWVIVGGESGNDARPMHPEWARSLRDQCADASVPFFFKQWGAWHPDFEAGAAIDDNPEQSRFDTCVWNPEKSIWERTRGSWDDDESWIIAEDYRQPEQPMTRVGKKVAGRLLDGVEHNGMPA